MKRQLLVSLVLLVTASLWARVANRPHPGGLPPWHDPLALNVDGIRLGMDEEAVRQIGMGFVGDIVWSPSKRVRCTFGTELMEGTTVVASYKQTYDAVSLRMGHAIASTGHGYFDGVSFDYYAAGPNWVIVRYPHPVLDYRSGPTPDFALADSIDSVPDNWGRDILEAALARH